MVCNLTQLTLGSLGTSCKPVLGGSFLLESIVTHLQKTQRINELENTVVFATNMLNDLLRYIQSSKFHCGDSLDNYVCCDDIQSRIVEIRSNL